MGRTVCTASMLINEEQGRWRGYRSSLRMDDRESFDRLIAYAKKHFSAIQNSRILDPFEAVMLSIILEFEKRLEVLEGDRTPFRHTSSRWQTSIMDAGEKQGCMQEDIV